MLMLICRWYEDQLGVDNNVSPFDLPRGPDDNQGREVKPYHNMLSSFKTWKNFSSLNSSFPISHCGLHNSFRSDYCQQCWKTFDPNVFFDFLLSFSSWLQNSKSRWIAASGKHVIVENFDGKPPSRQVSSLFDLKIFLLLTKFSIFSPKHVVIAENCLLS